MATLIQLMQNVLSQKDPGQCLGNIIRMGVCLGMLSRKNDYVGRGKPVFN